MYEDSIVSHKIDTRYAEDNIVFDISDCCVDKRYSLLSLDKESLKRMLGKLKDIRKLTWKQFSNYPRNTGLTKEKDGTDSFNLIDSENTSLNKIVVSSEKHYFHFRIGAQNSTFRIFGYQNKNAFCITHIDLKGCIHDH